jgi:hypothetical protein
MKSKLIVSAIAVLFVQFAPMFADVAEAAPTPQFTETFVRPDRHKALTSTGVMVCAKPSAASTAGVETTVKITFPTLASAGTDFVVNSTAANWTVDTTSLPTEPGSSGPAVAATAWPGIGTATNVTGHTVTFPSGDLTAATLYCFHIQNVSPTLTMSSAATGNNIINATLWTLDSGPLEINRTNWSTSVISDDQIVVTAVVPPSFSISLSGLTDPFLSNLDPASIIATTGISVSIVTNAVGGWIAWVKDSQQGLYSATANYTIPTKGTINAAAQALTVGTEGYGSIAAMTTTNTGGCTPVIDLEYSNTPSLPTTASVGALSSTFQPVAACTRNPPAPGTSDLDVFSLTEYATIRGGTPAGSDYSDVITVVGAGNF